MSGSCLGAFRRTLARAVPSGIPGLPLRPCCYLRLAQGLRGGDIPLAARIFTIIDTLDAMTSDRPYRRALPFGACECEVQEKSGEQFDPALAAVFLRAGSSAWIMGGADGCARACPAHADGILSTIVGIDA